MSEAYIRPYHPADLPFYYKIVLETGKSGEDASAYFDDPFLLGHVYAASYVHMDPHFALSLILDELPVGYVLGTPNSEAYEGYFLETWVPLFRKMFPSTWTYLPRQKGLLEHRVWNPQPEHHLFGNEYPAHLHIDILPIAQGMGMGRKLIEGFEDLLRDAGAPGIHLGVDPKNEKALGFYRRLGYQELVVQPYVIFMGKKLL